jgi:hypothetical protein
MGAGGARPHWHIPGAFSRRSRAGSWPRDVPQTVTSPPGAAVLIHHTSLPMVAFAIGGPSEPEGLSHPRPVCSVRERGAGIKPIGSECRKERRGESADRESATRPRQARSALNAIP